MARRHVLYLGEISPSQAASWRKSIEVFDADAGHSRTLALFPEDRCATVTPDSSIVQLRLSEMRLCRPRQWGACWLAGQLWEELQLDRFWTDRLPANRKACPCEGARACAHEMSHPEHSHIFRLPDAERVRFACARQPENSRHGTIAWIIRRSAPR